MKLIIQPDDGANSLLEGIENARESIEIAIFRFDHDEIRAALERAVRRGVSVHALIANTNRGNEKDLRKLEMNLLPAGIEVSRTARNPHRHHYKFMIVDRRVLYLLTFNFTYLDMRSRSFGVVIKDRELVPGVVRLFYADLRRQAYSPELTNLIVSPFNARSELLRFLGSAEKQLLIYDPEVSDGEMLRVLRERRRAGVEIRIIGRLPRLSREVGKVRLLPARFHTRAIIRDEMEAFLGSQSLRKTELDRRRELGLILSDREIVLALMETFEDDWAMASRESDVGEVDAFEGTPKKAVKALVKELSRRLPASQAALRRVIAAAVKGAFERTASRVIKRERAARV